MPRRPDLERAGANALRRPRTAIGGRLRPWEFWLAVACILLAGAGQARAASPNQATSSRAARDEAMRSIPLDKIDAGMTDKIRSAMAHASIYRRLPIQVTDCDPDLYLFLVRHPEVVVNIWEVMKISNVALARTGADTFRASDGAGTLCDVKFCYSDHETHVIYAEGSYDGPLFNRPVRAKCVLRAQERLHARDRRAVFRHQPDGHVHSNRPCRSRAAGQDLAAAGASLGRLQLCRDGRLSGHGLAHGRSQSRRHVSAGRAS